LLKHLQIVAFASACAPPSPPFAKLAWCKQVPRDGACETRTHHWITGPFWPPKGWHSRVEFVTPQKIYHYLCIYVFIYLLLFLFFSFSFSKVHQPASLSHQKQNE
jgi:hypothetical protein